MISIALKNEKLTGKIYGQSLEREVVGGEIECCKIWRGQGRDGATCGQGSAHSHTKGGGTKHVTHDQMEVGGGGHVLCLTLGMGQ